MSSNWKRAAMAGTALLVVVAVAWWSNRPRAVPVRLAEVATGVVERLVANTRGGTVNACRRARLAPSTGGTIQRLSVTEGTVVKVGQELITLWNDDHVAQVTLAESEARAARASAEQACLMADVARREAVRLDKLRSRSLVSEERLDQAGTEALAREAACVAARAGADVAENRVTVARTAVERSVIRAPFAGTVAEVNGELGEYLTPSPPGIPTPPAVDLIDTSCLYVSAPIDEVDAPAIHPGLTAHVSLDAFPERRYPGTVRRVAPYVRELEKQARTVEIEVALAGDGVAGLLPGYTADVEVVIERRDAVLRLPVEALLDGDAVLRLDPGSGTLERRALQVGLRNWQYAEVRAGLAAGDRVALGAGSGGVVDGARVEPEAERGERR